MCMSGAVMILKNTVAAEKVFEMENFCFYEL